MIRQRLTLVGGSPGGVWSCAACGSELSDGTISHRDDCRWVAEIREAEREACAVLAAENFAHYDCDPDYGTPAADLIRSRR